MSFLFIVSIMITFALAMAIGFIARKLGVMNDDFDGSLSRLVLDVTLPCLIVSSVFSDQLPDTQGVLDILSYSFAVYALLMVLAFVLPLLLGTSKDARGVYSFMTAFGNTGFVGLPVIAAIFGPHAVLYGAIAQIPFNLTVFTLGVAFVSKGEGGFFKRMASNAKNLLSPALVSCALAFVLALAHVNNAGIIGDALTTIGAMTTPAALLILGSSLAKYSPKTMLTNWRAYAAAAFRLVVAPLAVYFAFRSIIPDPLLLGVLVVTCGMPVATNGLLLCLRYNGDLHTMTQGVFLSTIASVISIPCIAMLVL